MNTVFKNQPSRESAHSRGALMLKFASLGELVYKFASLGGGAHVLSYTYRHIQIVVSRHVNATYDEIGNTRKGNQS